MSRIRNKFKICFKIIIFSWKNPERKSEKYHFAHLQWKYYSQLQIDRNSCSIGLSKANKFDKIHYKDTKTSFKTPDTTIKFGFGIIFFHLTARLAVDQNSGLRTENLSKNYQKLHEMTTKTSKTCELGTKQSKKL